MIGILALALLVLLGVIVVRRFLPEADWSTQVMTGVIAAILLPFLFILAFSVVSAGFGILGILGIVFSGLIIWRFNRKMLRGAYASR